MALRIPISCLTYLTCENCKAYLSCGPVFVLQNGKSVCGRCKPERYFVRSEMFESVAKMFKFPCKYWEERCPVILNFDQIEKHERSCKYRNKCALFFSHPTAVCKSKLTVNPTEGVRFFEIPPDLQTYLTCSICQYYLNCNPIYVARSNHHICHRCYVSYDLSQCVIDMQLENLLKLLIFPCIFKNWGCPMKMTFGESCYSHELECAYGNSYNNKKNTTTTTTTSNSNGYVQPDGKVKGLVESHRGPVWATITPTSIPFGQGVIKLTTPTTYENNRPESFNNQPVVDINELKQMRKNSPPNEEFVYENVVRDEPIYENNMQEINSNRSGSSNHESEGHGAYSNYSYKDDEQSVDSAFSNTLQYTPGYGTQINRTGSFLESKIKPIKPLQYTESRAGEQYHDIMKELKLRQKLSVKSSVGSEDD